MHRVQLRSPPPEIRRVEHAVFHPVRTKHATLAMARIEDSIRFYTQTIGLDLLVYPGHRAYALLGGTCGERNIALIQAPKDTPASMHHFGVEMFSEAELDASVARLQADGLIAEKAVDHPLRRAVFLRDPDGLRLQLFVDRIAEPPLWADVDPQQAAWVL